MREDLHEGCARAAWAYLFLYLDINLGTVSVLPAFVGYGLLYSAIGLLEGERRDLGLLRNLCILLGLWAGADWLLSWVGGGLDGRLYPLDVIVQAVSLYFHFQLFTDFAALAAEYQAEGDGLDRRLLRRRTIQVVLGTVLFVLVSLRPADGSWGTTLALGLVVVNAVVGFMLMAGLFQLRECFEGEETET